MTMWKKIATTSAVAISFVVCSANANMIYGNGNWGMGLYGGMQGCNVPYGVASGSSSISDEAREMAQEVKELQRTLSAKKNDLKRIERNLDRSKRDVERVLEESYTDMIWEHIENNVSCSEYRFDGDDVNAKGSEGGSGISGVREVHGFQLNEWLATCDNTKPGSVKNTTCDVRIFQKNRGGGNTAACKKGLADYRKDYSSKSKIAGEIESLEARIEYLKEDIKYALEDSADRARDSRYGGTEGGVCIECLAQGSGYQYEQRKTDWGSVIGNIAMGLGSVYLGYKTNKIVSENNATNGWPTDPYATVGYGYGLGAIATGISQSYNGQSGIYGSVGGGIGNGAFGCAGANGGAYGMMGPYAGANGNGMWGNPYAMQSMGMGYPGMGVFMPGMGPWGMNGPYGMMGPNGNMGMYMSAIASGIMGAYPGSMMGGYPGAMASYSGGMTAMMGAYPGAMMGAYAGGAMMGAYPGAMMGGYPGAMAGGAYPGAMMSGIGSAIMGAYPGAMMGSYPGAMGGGMAGMMGAYPGAMMSGMGGAMMGSYPGAMAGGMMGNMMGNMMGTYGGGMMGSYSNSLGAMQLQQQMMQAQMQQYQQYIQQQQNFMQAEMQKQQVLAGLQSELYTLMSKIQATQFGNFSGGTLGGTTGSYIGYPNSGTAPIPINGGTTGGGSTLPVPINTGTPAGNSSR